MPTGLSCQCDLKSGVCKGQPTPKSRLLLAAALLTEWSQSRTPVSHRCATNIPVTCWAAVWVESSARGQGKLLKGLQVSVNPEDNGLSKALPRTDYILSLVLQIRLLPPRTLQNPLTTSSHVPVSALGPQIPHGASPRLKKQCKLRITLLWLSFVACHLPAHTLIFRQLAISACLQTLSSRAAAYIKRNHLVRCRRRSRLEPYSFEFVRNCPPFKFHSTLVAATSTNLGFFLPSKIILPQPNPRRRSLTPITSRAARTAQPLRQDECRRLRAAQLYP